MTYALLALISMALGYGAFFGVYKILPKRLKADHRKQFDDIVDDARRQAVERRRSEAERLEDEQQIMLEQLESDISERHEDLKLEEEDVAARERSLLIEESRIEKMDVEAKSYEESVAEVKTAYESRVEEITSIKLELTSHLEATAHVEAATLLKNMRDGLIESRQIEAQKALRFFDDELSSSSKRLAQRLMARVMSRYAPEFYWPKSINFVELADRQLAERIANEGQGMIDEFKEKAGIEIELLAGPEQMVPTIKLAGGAGVDREAVRMAFTEVLAKGPGAWNKAASAFDKHRAALEQEAIRLGQQAVIEVQLSGIHPELQKLIGYLNWRTSYRQNQWYHTVEVAKLAGILASELGLDPDAAKRCGLLHDVGKALDYRIEGSHAVISGDYADRFGEQRIICDTVMSHHNDLIIESPLAYVLRAADTLSGARPGARVNLEEGYQMRLSGIESVVRSFPGVVSMSIMNGAREVHVEVNNKRVHEQDLEKLSQNIARRIETDVAYPGEIKIIVTRRFEATAVA
jgi:ribonuclease Y